MRQANRIPTDRADVTAAFDHNRAAMAAREDVTLVADVRGYDRDGDFHQRIVFRRYYPDGGYRVETRHYYWPL